jgi:spore coat protein U-like protein
MHYVRVDVRVYVRIFAVLLGLGLLALPGVARAQYCNNTLIGGLFYGYVSVSATSLAFGAYSPQAAVAQQSTVTVTAACAGGLVAGGTLPPFTVAMSTGSGSFAQRKMTSATYSLKYQIYTSASLATVWGDGTGSTSTVPGGNGGVASQTLTGYGVISTSQYVTPGSYTDNITVTLTY